VTAWVILRKLRDILRTTQFCCAIGKRATPRPISEPAIMELERALQLIRERFQEEQRGELETKIRSDFEAASAAWPVTMLVALHQFAETFQQTLPPLAPISERPAAPSGPDSKRTAAGSR
jgi:hypothetical protein